MEGIQYTLSILSAILVLLGSARYIMKMSRGKQPEKASWIIWSCLDMILAFQMYTANTLNYQMGAAVIGTVVITTFAFKYGKPGVKWYDVLCLIGAGFGIYLWWKMGSVTIGIVISAFIILLGSVPTCISVWEDPKREDPKVWKIFLFSSVFEIMALSTWTLDHATQPIVFLVSQAIMVLLLAVRPSSLARERSLRLHT